MPTPVTVSRARAGGHLVPRCPVCRAEAGGAPQAKAEGYTIYDCPMCGLRFSDPMRHPGGEWYENSAFYRQMLRRSIQTPMRLIRREWKHRKVLELGLRPGGLLLEVGCGTGEFLRLATEHGYRVGGIDIDPGALEIARTRSGIRNARVLSVDDLIAAEPDAMYDVICMFDVLEHLADPIKVVRGLGRLLRPGGFLIFSVPGARRWPSLFYEMMDDPPNHLTLWTPDAIGTCIAAARLDVVDIHNSPVTSEHLWGPLVARLPSALRTGLPGVALKMAAHFFLAPPIARVISLSPRAGGFRWLGIAVRPAAPSPATTGLDRQDADE
jgi:SAM-dependent methyltransferase